MTTKTITIELENRARGKIICDDMRLFDAIRESLSIYNTAHRFSPHASPRIYAITANGTFPIGLLDEVVNTAKKIISDLDIKIDDKLLEALEPLRKETIEIINPPNTNYVYRDYQIEGISPLLKRGTGVIVLPTSAGKSLVGYGLFSSLTNHFKDLDLKYLILVPNISLVEQFYDDFLDYGIQGTSIKIAKYSSSERILDLDANVIITNRDWLEEHYKEFPHIDVILVDECIRGGQRVNCKNGFKNIENINIGDEVLTYNFKENKKEFKNVKKIFKNLYKSSQYDKFIKLTLENGTIIEVTPNHEIFLENGFKKRADQLNFDDDIKFI